MAYLYRINWKNHIYIGELTDTSGNSDYIQYHISRALPWLSRDPTGWENDVYNTAKRIGWKATITNFHNSGHIDSAVAQQSISDHFDKLAITLPTSPFYKSTNYIKGTAYKNIYNILSPNIRGMANTELLTIESLLISANAYQHSYVLNQHINTDYQPQSYLTKSDIINLFSPNKLKQYEQKIKTWVPHIYVGVDLKSLPKKITNMIKGHYRRGIDIVKEKEFFKAIQKPFTETSLKILLKQLQRLRELFVIRGARDPAALNIVAAIDKYIKNDVMHLKPGNMTYDQVAESIERGFQNTVSVELKNISLITTNYAQGYSDLLLEFFKTFKTASLFKKDNYIQKLFNYIPESLTKKMNSLYQEIAPYNANFEKWQNEQAELSKTGKPRFDANGQKTYKYFYIRYATDLASGYSAHTPSKIRRDRSGIYPTLSEQIKTKMQNLGWLNDAIDTNWKIFYSETVSIYLHSNKFPSAWKYDEIKNFSHISSSRDLTLY